MNISALVVVYNQPLTLRWLLTSLLDQDYQGAYEILVCDDGSTREILDVVADIDRAHQPDIRYIWQPDRGFRAGRSRNNGIRAAQGDLLVFLDADQVVDRDFLTRHAAAHTHPRQLVVGPMKRVPPDAAAWTTGTEALQYARALTGPNLFPEAQDKWARSAYPWMSCLSGNLSCDRRPEVAFDEGFIGWGGEDRELAYRLTRRFGYELTFDKSTVSYHVSGDGGTFFKDHDKIVQFLRNRLYFRSLYPDADLVPVFGAVRYCRLNRQTNRWFVDVERPETRPPEAILNDAAQWMRQEGLL